MILPPHLQLRRTILINAVGLIAAGFIFLIVIFGGGH